MKLVLQVLATACILASAARGATPLGPVPAPANLRVASIQLRIAPDHRDWTYALGEQASFRITVTADNTPVDHATVTYSVGPDLFPGPKQTAAVPPEGLVVDGGTLTTGGFLRCKAAVEIAGRTYTNSATAAFAPGTIRPTQVDPADFDAYWRGELEKLARIPVAARVTLQPDACTDDVNVYHVGIATISGPEGTAQPARVYGILCEPKKPGKYPAVLRVPGAHVRPYFGDKDLAARGVITLEIGVEGVPVNLAKELYDALDTGAMNGAWYNNLDDRDQYYYHRVFLGCIRANDFLASREMWNGRDLLVMGASQGGALAIVTAALDPRVTGLAATHPALCDLTGELHGRAGGFPHPFRPAADGTPSRHATPAKIATSAYYDTVNFAKRLKAPGFYIWGYNDEVCPPTSTFAAFNVITAPKTLAVEPEQFHSYPPEQGEAINAWVATTLNLK